MVMVRKVRNFWERANEFMQEHTTHNNKGRLPDAGLCEGSDFEKKEGVKVLTPDGVGKMAKALRRRLATRTDNDGGGVGMGKKEEGGCVAVATVRRHYYNRHLVGCEMEGVVGLVNVRVRDSAYYGKSEVIEVEKKDGGWVAKTQRQMGRYRN